MKILFKCLVLSYAFCNSYGSLAQSLESLESQTLSQYPEFLPDVERNIVREIQAHPDSAYAHYLLSHVYLRLYVLDTTQNYYADKAVSLGQQSLDLDPNGEFGYLALSDAYRVLGFGEKAWSILQEAPPLSRSWRFQYRVIKNQYEKSNPQKDLEALEKTIHQQPESRDIIVPLMLTLSKNFDESSYFEKLTEWNKGFEHPLIEQELAIRHLSKGRQEKAQAIFEKIWQKSKAAYPEIAMNYGILLFTEFHKYKEAERILEDVLKSSSFPKSLSSMTNRYLTLVYLEKKDQLHSMDAMIQALNTSTQPLETLEFIGLNIIKQKPELFAKYMNVVNSYFPGNAEFYVLQGKLYAENLGLSKEALAHFAKAAILEPELTKLDLTDRR